MYPIDILSFLFISLFIDPSLMCVIVMFLQDFHHVK